MSNKITLFLLAAIIMSSCGIIKISPVSDNETEAPPTEIDAVPPAQEDAQVEDGAGEEEANEAETESDRELIHGVGYALMLPLISLAVFWIFFEILIIVPYLQPRGVDVATVLIKAQDGLFLEARVSMTARRQLTVASTRMTWSRVRDLVEKNIEQELLHAAITYPSLEELEQNLKAISDKLIEVPVVETLSRDFGVKVLWFNIEIQYPQETMDALQQKAEASVGGTAYLAFAAAAHLNPDSSECRELYTVYQKTSGQVDAARNLGGGITSIAEYIARRTGQDGERQDDRTDN